MRNTGRIIVSDCKSLFVNAMSIIITVGLIVMPSMFAWYNVIACWNVFDNTGNLKVAVANADEGYQSELVPLRVNVGEQVVSSLRANNQMDWIVTTPEDAIDGARSGRYYAAVVIPQEFSKDMMSFYSSEVEHARIIYYANEKKSAIAPKITDKGADTISYQINETFAQTLSEVGLNLAESFSSYLDDADAESAVAKMSAKMRKVADQADSAALLLGSYGDLAQASEKLVSDSVDLITSAADEMKSTQDGVAGARDAGRTIVENLSGSLDQLEQALSANNQAFLDLSSSVDSLCGNACNTAASTAAEIRTLSATPAQYAQDYRAIATALENVKPSLPPDAQTSADLIIARFNASAAQYEAVSQNMTAAADALEAGNADAQQKLIELKESIARAQASLQGLQDEYRNTIKPELQDIVSTTSSLLDGIDTTASQLSDAATGLSGGGASVKSALEKGTSQVQEATNGLQTCANELRESADRIDEALASGSPDKLREVLTNDTSVFARALAAPVSIERTAVFPVDNFGSAMAPFYTTLALFIGSLLILVVVKPQVTARPDLELSDMKPYQLFLGRFGVLALLSFAQTTVMALGNLFFLQVQVAEPLLFLLCFWIAGWVFTFIIYALVAAFANLGKAMAVLLLIIQVTGCGGSFPLQILPDFIQKLSPWLPATHVVNAMRSAMFGVYGNDFWLQMGLLLLFVLPAALIGLVLRKPLARFMNWYVEQVESTEVIG